MLGASAGRRAGAGRRDFVATAGPGFFPGYYEDFSWSIPALLAAGQVAVSGRIAVGSRKCLSTSISRGANPRQMEVFDQFDRILAFLAHHPEVDSRGVRQVLAAGAQGFLRSRTERLKVIPPDRVLEFRRRSDDVVARLAERE